MKVLVIGSGGREHALVKSFSHSPSINEVHAIPGNDGMRSEALCHALDWRDFESIIQFCIKNEISYVFIGPEDPLVAGLADALRERGILTVGPSKEAAQLEGSKVFAKNFMLQAEIPTAFSEEVFSVQDVIRLSGRFTAPFVLKADGLAAGKGVFICKNLDELKQAAVDIFEKQILGAAGAKALLEQFTPGWELSYLVVTNGETFQSLPIAQDHKRLQDKDEGPNTGGMGTVAPLRVSPELQSMIDNKVVIPTLKKMKEDGFIYRGVLFIGIMVTDKGPSVLEFNCRFGDPETQVILPLLNTDVGHYFYEVSKGHIPPLKTKNMSAACVVMAAPGYPQNPEKGVQIEGDPLHQTPSSYFIHAGAKLDSKQWTTQGGRVLCAVGLGSTLSEALQTSYEQARNVQWRGVQMRKDIGQKLLK